MIRILALWQQLTRGSLSGVTRLIVAASSTVCLLAIALIPTSTQPATQLTLVYVVLLSTAHILILSRIMAHVRDVGYSISLFAFLERHGWKPVAYFVDGGAANPSLSLLLTKILALCGPRRILELGSGQSTKLLNCYALDHAEVTIRTLEQDRVWQELLSRQLQFGNHALILSPLQERRFTPAGMSEPLITHWYAPDAIGPVGSRFDLIVVDGPDPGGSGTDLVPYARAGVLEHLPAILGDPFAIVYDDADRYGELMTIRATERVLTAAGRRFTRFELHGVKSQVVFVSPEWAFLRSV